ncbi:hypothetical protein CVD25_05075 [Bacillus canaveralius]|uniref:Uncharacterized protein n=1 Tax=Bacillus canaveralius TaxID=1403243 RepID=A0A2N5GRL4_9BACI|nr:MULTISPECIES: hypothetical protein [Bacillus]PLR84572.1 hypothetical protein CVD23_11740 [Bacillus sp. V33-4]PLR86086.1 hypothetical protein CU635_03365 [Bacillus canaveralius]PLS00206.1 hypothetical protein CVD25_05075 [Bacillus canaveralius]RSK52030.1 hypothetical protein EJA13_12690 [Bacillus canaveralius]
MLIKQCKGYELEKEQSNSFEDYFNRSEITFIEGGVEKTVHVLYVRFFEESMQEFTPFKQDPIFQADSSPVYFRDIVALACLLKNPGFRHRKRIYINNRNEFAAYFQDLDYKKLPEIFAAIGGKQGYELRSPLEFIVQPH